VETTRNISDVVIVIISSRPHPGSRNVTACHGKQIPRVLVPKWVTRALGRSGFLLGLGGDISFLLFLVLGAR
jgi:hypothetical protein